MSLATVLNSLSDTASSHPISHQQLILYRSLVFYACVFFCWVHASIYFAVQFLWPFAWCRCIAPAHPEFIVRFEVSVNCIDFTQRYLQFSFYFAPRIDSISLPRDLRVGGTLLTVTGYDIQFSPDLACKFGPLGETSATWLTYTEVSCLSPPSGDFVGFVRVTLTLNALDYSAGDGAWFEYVDDIAVTSVVPDTVYLNTIHEVTIYGTEFVQSMRCRFGNVSVVRAQFISSDGACGVLMLLATFYSFFRLHGQNAFTEYGRANLRWKGFTECSWWINFGRVSVAFSETMAQRLFVGDHTLWSHLTVCSRLRMQYEIENSMVCHAAPFSMPRVGSAVSPATIRLHLHFFFVVI